MTQTITAKQIHEDFYGAEERLFVEAVGLSRGSLVTTSSKAERLKKIGFGKAKPIKDSQEQEKKRAISGHIVRAIEYFRTYYPQYKFITEAEVQILCTKYGLLLGDASDFIGDMPEKNLADIERFKLRKEDWKEKQAFYYWGGLDEASQFPSESGLVFVGSRRIGLRSEYDRLMAAYLTMNAQPNLSPWLTGVDPYSKPEPSKEYEQPAFKICAPKEDFDTRGYEIRDGYKLIYDPIVLQAVSKDGIDGYLIVTAWGDESADELVKSPDAN